MFPRLLWILVVLLAIVGVIGVLQWSGVPFDGNAPGPDVIEPSPIPPGQKVLARRPVCNNNVREFGETCDRNDLAGKTCLDFPSYVGGTLQCNNTCNGFIFDGCRTAEDPECGDGAIEGTEQCEGNNLNGQSCQTLGYTTGTLSCYPTATPNQCQFNVSNCLPQRTIEGELRQWHRVTLTLDGPVTSEGAATNPFTSYRLNVTFTGPGGTFIVPGYYAADGQAAETSATNGNKWRVHFTPNATGNWTYRVSFRQGNWIAINTNSNDGTAVAPLDGASGEFRVEPSDKIAPDFRVKGMLKYVNQHYLQFAGSQEYFIKGGVDSPENFLTFADFDGTQAGRRGLHLYDDHVQDWQVGDPVWKTSKGKGIIGLVNYLSSKGMNNIYFLTMNTNRYEPPLGDGEDVWPWTSKTERERFDVSKLDQWEIVFSHMDKKGIQLHVVTQEQETDQDLEDDADSGFSNQRKLYYRELIARFSHHLALQWNVGEENTNTTTQQKQFADYIRLLDPYDHPITVHTDHVGGSLNGGPGVIYPPLYGYPSYEAASMQLAPGQFNEWTLTVRNRSASSSPIRKWVVYVDEAYPISEVPANPTDSDLLNLRKAMYGNLFGGGAGVEWILEGDLTLNSLRPWERLWDQTKIATDFMQTIPFVEMQPDNSLIEGGETRGYAFYRPNTLYVVYFKGTSYRVNLSAGNYSLKWFNPSNGQYSGPFSLASSGGLTTLTNRPSGSTDMIAHIARQ